MLVLAIKLSKNKKDQHTKVFTLAKKQQHPTTLTSSNTENLHRTKRNDWVQTLHLQNEIEDYS